MSKARLTGQAKGALERLLVYTGPFYRLSRQSDRESQTPAKASRTGPLTGFRSGSLKAPRAAKECLSISLSFRI